MLVFRHRGFTLIELLIVVAIIAILAAIAVPNFLEAQVRSKVSRAKNDMRSIANALEMYRTDNNDYPLDNNFYSTLNWVGRQPKPNPMPPAPILYLSAITTPIAYMSSIPRNPFPLHTYNNYVGSVRDYQYDYAATDWMYTQILFRGLPQNGAKWVLNTCGPDMVPSGGEYMLLWPKTVLTGGGFGSNSNPGGIYDPTNGTISWGDIVRVGP